MLTAVVTGMFMFTGNLAFSDDFNSDVDHLSVESVELEYLTNDSNLSRVPRNAIDVKSQSVPEPVSLILLGGGLAGLVGLRKKA